MKITITTIHKLSIFIIVVCAFILGYISFESFFFVKNHKININGEIYTNRVSTQPYIRDLSINLTKDCKDDVCRVQNILDFVTNIEYKINPTIAKSTKDTLTLNYGDCDDKSNLLISLLKAEGYQALFVVVPKHIFVIVNLVDKKLKNIKGLYIDGKKYYILESTAKNSKIGFPLQYPIDSIEAIIDPFENEKLHFQTIEFKN